MLLLLFSAGNAQAKNKTPSKMTYQKYGVEVEILARNTAENDEWLLAIKTALNLLSGSPEVLAKIIQNNEKILKFSLIESPDSSYAGLYSPNTHSITINQTPKFNNFYGKGHEWNNGFLRATKLYVVMHELGHAYDDSNGRKPAMSLYSSVIKKNADLGQHRLWAFIDFLAEMPPTKYPFSYCDDDFNFTEDFADTFALYVIWPSTLKNFPMRHVFLKTIFGKKYKDYAGIIPSAIEVRFFKKNEEIKCKYDDLFK